MAVLLTGLSVSLVGEFNMDKYEQLFIRACKRNNDKSVLLRIMKRFYLGHDCILDDHTITGLICHLGDIVDKYCPIRSVDMISELNPDKLSWYSVKDTRSYKEIALDTLISRIKLSRKDKFEGLTAPCWVANKEKSDLKKLNKLTKEK